MPKTQKTVTLYACYIDYDGDPRLIAFEASERPASYLAPRLPAFSYRSTLQKAALPTGVATSPEEAFASQRRARAHSVEVARERLAKAENVLAALDALGQAGLVPKEPKP